MTAHNVSFDNVCYVCIGDQFLADEVKTNGDHGVCTYCGQSQESVSLVALADRVHETINEHFQLTPDGPVDWYDHYLAGEGEWERRGEPVAEVICDMASITPEMATDIRKILSDKYGYVIMREEFKGDPFGLEAKYEEQGPDHRLFKNAWEAFCDELTFRMRFFSPVAQGTLTEILGDLATLKTHDDEPVIRDIDPGEDGALVWRGRIAQSEDQLKAILKSPAQELAPPPPNLTVSGRMNVHGIPVFYPESTEGMRF